MDTLSQQRTTSRTAQNGDSWRALPEEAPLAMPEQSFWARWPRSARPPTTPRLIMLRRALVLLATIAMTSAAAYEMYQVLHVAGLTVLEACVLILFVALFAWIAFSFVTALAGFISVLFGRARLLGISVRAPLPSLSHRTALLLPVYNETPARVMARLQAIYESLDAIGALAHFDFFILSDTTDPDIWIAEESEFLALRERTGGEDRIFYRHRPKNEGRKAGNIAEWVKRFGAKYDHMIVLDADSLMSGDTIVRLAAAMEAHPKVGLIQTLPVIINGSTLFARAQQFAGRMYGPLLAHGLAWWHGGESNYWGHNAIIRTRAFAEQAGLPSLPGRKPIGGHIMSHDFVEAALLRRGGWAVHLAPEIGGSYEEGPPSLTDYAERDRRWCQGNLQHIGVLPARGLHWVSRLHLLTGIGSYITAPMWLGFLLIGILISLQAQFIRPEYFPEEFSLFPLWPAQDPVRAAWVFAGTMGLLVAPKLLGYLAALIRSAQRKGHGGGVRALLSVLLETLVSGLIAPVNMLLQSVTVLSSLFGRDIGWQVQRRDDGTLPFNVIVRRYGWQTAFGALLAAAAYAVSISLLLWMTPVIVGLLLAIPLAAGTAGPHLGQALRRLGLLLIPEERDPPPIIRRAHQLEAEAASASAECDGLSCLLADPALRAAHSRMIAKPVRRPGDVDVDLVLGLAKLDDAETIEDVRRFLTRAELLAVLSDPRGIARIALLTHNGRQHANHAN
ncbi:MAG: glucans biosynthesis glucosyltransferase MdoH [Rhizobiales bacterium]|nr:glucans biosynthesis glucosyltransferase MdoH [Hyphomicrobiales bacterium]